MAEGEPTIVAENGTVVEAGGVYLTFSGDPDKPYTFAKVIRIGRPAPSTSSPLLWVRLDRRMWAERPAGWEWSKKSKVVEINVAVFLAWGPPKFPVRVGTEAITPDELAAAQDERHAEPGAAADGVGM